MLRSIFRKDIEPMCQYCVHGEPLDEEQVACVRKGIVSAGHHCLGFKYDPYKRVPKQEKAPDFSKFSDEDFSL